MRLLPLKYWPVLREWRLADEDIVNVNGSGISLGHPIAATGARILATMLHEMKRRQSKYGLETMCVAGGQGVAAVFELAALDDIYLIIAKYGDPRAFERPFLHPT